MKKDLYEIYADEAWTSNALPLRRYWCFFGAIMGSHADLDRLDKELKKVKARHSLRAEIKWTKISADRLPCYKEFVDCFFENLKKLKTLRYRQLFLDRSFVHADSFHKNPQNLYSMEVQFKVYYQFLKHHFEVQRLPISSNGTRISFFLDDHSSQKHKGQLQEFVQDLPRFMKRTDLEFKVSFMNSGAAERIQICDLLMGAAGSHGNKMQKIRTPGVRGMSAKQKLRDDFCKHIYNHLRQISCEERGANAFHWFESTGWSSSKAKEQQKIRIWKFVPSSYFKDRGWENRNLAKDGSYIAPQIDASGPSLSNFDPEDSAGLQL